MKRFGKVVVTLLKLAINNVQLTICEKLTILLSAGVMLCVAIVMASIALFFFMLGFVELFSLYMPVYMSYFIVSVMSLVIGSVVYFFRKKLILNPMARFLTRLILKEPQKTKI